MSDSNKENRAHEALLEWYECYGRKSMPIRHLHGPNAPYEVYISEIMSQQTQIGVVLERFFDPFLKAFPTLKALALAPLDQVLLLWKGLGYYTRAKNLHKSAQICAQLYGGKLPKDYRLLRALPGVGDYSARAVLCFGFREAVGVVDANVARVLLRFFAITPKQKGLASLLQSKADAWLNTNNPFDHNQALIDLGALVCTKTPQCHLCPLSFACQGKNNIQEFSLVKKTPSVPLSLLCGICVQEGHIYLSYKDEGLYAHLYQIPLLKNQEITPLPYLGQVRHSYTKYRVRAQVYQASVQDLQEAHLQRIALDQLKNTPISALTAKILKLAGL
ncbi:A/G-specific adenine glycosylase [Helicobacter felis]|uniref:A/G-specific adenine glycosylase n=1 Tax=Helicobacter felis TaxID=214 RepID=UPI000CEEF50C|nr:A/G-specific adenine glycosylase [Helicobacter felis]